MYYFIMPSKDIRVNLATEQYLLEKYMLAEPLVLFYIQEPCVIVGRNQNVRAEVDLDYAKEKNITVTRRLSGGGAVYDDLGNLSFSFVLPIENQKLGDFSSFTQPIIQALHKMGAQNAQVGGRNDLLIDGKKFSGNAVYTKNKKMYAHGTLMFDVDLDEVNRVLTVSKQKLISNGVKSVRKRVTNLKPYLAEAYQKISTEEFRDLLLLHLFNAKHLSDIKAKEYLLTDTDQQTIHQLVTDVYANEHWIFGEEPQYTLKRTGKYAGGFIELHLTIDQNKIVNIAFYGDYFQLKDPVDLVQQLKGMIYEKKVLALFLHSFNISDYFLNITNQEFLQLMID